jgi:hypothetical protein
VPDQTNTPHSISPNLDQEIGASLPTADRTAEQLGNAQKGLEQHEARQRTDRQQGVHHRREHQETLLITQEQVDRGATPAPQTTRSHTGSGTRTRQQADQSNQQDAEVSTATKRSRGKRGDLESKLRTLAVTIGPDQAQVILEKTEACCRRSESGFTLPPSEVKQLAKDLAATLKGRVESPSIGVTPSAQMPTSADEITERVTEMLIKSDGVIEPVHVLEALTPSPDAQQPNGGSTALSALVDSRTGEDVIQILDSGAATTQELATLRADLPPEEQPSFHAAIIKWEVDHSAPVITHVIENDEARGISSGAAVAAFIEKVIPQHRQLAYKGDLSHYVAREHTAFIEENARAQQALRRELTSIRERVNISLERALRLDAIIRGITGGSALLPGAEQRLRSLDPANKEFREALLEAIDRVVASTDGVLAASKNYNLSADATLLLSEELTFIRQERATLPTAFTRMSEIALALQELQLLYRERIELFWARYGTVLEQCGYVRPRSLQRPEHDGERTIIRFAEDSPHAPLEPFHREDVKRVLATNSGGQGTTVLVTEDPPTQFELRHKADIERGIAEDHARRFVLAGDFANADAAIAAYNNRFPEFQISSSTLVPLKEKVMAERRVEEA